MDVIAFFRTAQPFVQMVSEVPWDKFLPKEPLPLPSQMVPPELLSKPLYAPAPKPLETPPAATPIQASTRTAAIAKPGCTAADESLVVQGHLAGLAAGEKGFGVLATDIERLERAAQGAEQMGSPEVAAKIRGVKDALPTIHDSESAAKLQAELESFSHDRWELGRTCGSHSSVTPELRAKAEVLARRVKAGEITREQAVEELRKG